MVNNIKGKKGFRPIDPMQRFMEKIQKDPSGCWLWTGSLSSRGYGFFYLNGRNTHASRASLKLFKNIDLGKLFACHHCDNPRCVNPDHLFPGTNSDNMKDSVKKGRHAAQLPGWKESVWDKMFANLHRGHKHPRARLTEQQAVEIMRIAYSEPATEVAKRYGICPQGITDIWKGKNWRVPAVNAIREAKP